MNKTSNTRNVQEKRTNPAGGNVRDEFPFTRENYKWLIIGIVVAFIGFVLMSGGGTNDPTQFDGDSLFSFRRLTLSPLMILVGFGVILYAIILKPKEQ